MTDRELMQQSLEAMETNQYAVADAAPHRDVMAYNDAITALRERLAQPEQEPVAWMHPDKYKTYLTTDPSEDLVSNGYWTPLYTTLPRREWVGLTEEEMVDLQDRCGISIHQSDFEAIEAKLREKNT